MTTTSGLGLVDDVQGVAAVGGGADDLDTVEGPEQGDEPVADDLVVVDHHDPDVLLAHPLPRRPRLPAISVGSQARTTVPPPAGT